MKTKMKTTLMLLLFPLLLFLVAHADASGETDLKCSQRTEAELGKNVTLDCYCEPRCDVTHKVLRWKFNQKTFVLAYNGTHDAKNEDPRFIGRVKVSSTERLKDGNFTVTISKVSKSDEGNYTCHVGRKTCSVELKAQGFELKCQEKPEKPVEVRVGQNVTLNCTSEPQLDLTEEKITWKFNSTIFFDVIDGKKTLYKQFRGRVHLVNDLKVSEGNLSVEISSVKENDTGVYTCSVLYGPNCTVTLTVKKEDKQASGAQGDNTTTTSDGLSTGAISGIVAGALVAAVIGALVTWKFHEKCKSLLSSKGKRGRKQNERGPSQDNHENIPLQPPNTT